MSSPTRVSPWIIIFYAMVYSRAQLENIQTHFVVRLSLDRASWTLKKKAYLYYYPMIIICNNCLRNPRITQCLHRKSWGGTWGFSQQ